MQRYCFAKKSCISRWRPESGSWHPKPGCQDLIWSGWKVQPETRPDGQSTLWIVYINNASRHQTRHLAQFLINAAIQRVTVITKQQVAFTETTFDKTYKASNFLNWSPDFASSLIPCFFSSERRIVWTDWISNFYLTLFWDSVRSGSSDLTSPVDFSSWMFVRGEWREGVSSGIPYFDKSRLSAAWQSHNGSTIILFLKTGIFPGTRWASASSNQASQAWLSGAIFADFIHRIVPVLAMRVQRACEYLGVAHRSVSLTSNVRKSQWRCSGRAATIQWAAFKTIKTHAKANCSLGTAFARHITPNMSIRVATIARAR